MPRDAALLASGSRSEHPEHAIGVELGPMATAAFMQAFFDQAARIKALMGTIRANIPKIEKNHEACLHAISPEDEHAAKEVRARLMEQTDAAVSQVQKMLKAMDAENKAFTRSGGTSEARIRANMHGTITRKFVEVMGDYQAVQTAFKNKYRERAERQFRIVKPDVTRAEVDEALEGDPDHTPEIFSQQIMQGSSHASAHNALADIQEKHGALRQLEASLQELHQLFIDMAVLVQSQGELLDQIEHTVSKSVVYTGKAVEELRTAAAYKQKARKKQWCVAITGLIILCVVVVPLLAGGSVESEPPPRAWEPP
jgi:t-SNARE complex subunit (syntaxin)